MKLNQVVGFIIVIVPLVYTFVASWGFKWENRDARGAMRFMSSIALMMAFLIAGSYIMQLS